MASKSNKCSQPVAETLSTDITAYWHQQISLLGRGTIFVDSGAILEAHNRQDKNYSQFFKTATFKFVTSSFVVAETARRFIKSAPYQFCGPAGEQQIALAIHFIRNWLTENRVVVLHVPEVVFDQACRTFEGNRHTGCDLNDIISFVIVKGLEQSRIAAKDSHFRTLGLTLLPGA